MILCFCLIDDAHKSIKDVDYRTDIVLPMDDFFKFKAKALVSATPIKFSDHTSRNASLRF